MSCLSSSFVNKTLVDIYIKIPFLEKFPIPNFSKIIPRFVLGNIVLARRENKIDWSIETIGRRGMEAERRGGSVGISGEGAKMKIHARVCIQTLVRSARGHGYAYLHTSMR